MSEQPTSIPAADLHELYRAYCLAKFDYSVDHYADGAGGREQHIDNDTRSYYEPGEEGLGGHVGPLARLVEAAYAKGAASTALAAGARPAQTHLLLEQAATDWAVADIVAAEPVLEVAGRG